MLRRIFFFADCWFVDVIEFLEQLKYLRERERMVMSTEEEGSHGKILRGLNVYGIGYDQTHQTGFNRSYYKQMNSVDRMPWNLSTDSGAAVVKSFTQVVQYGSMGQEFASEQELFEPGEHVVHVSCAENRSLFVTNHRRVFCCGENSCGCCGLSNAFSILEQVTLIPELSNCNIVETKCGTLHSFFISEGYESVFASGSNNHGECGFSNGTELVYGVVDVGHIDGKKLKHVAPGALHTVFVTIDNCVYTSGLGTFGSLGQGHMNQQGSIPVKLNHPDLGGSKVIKSAVCGLWHSILIAEDGSAYAWGSNEYFQCGLAQKGIASPALVTGIPSYEKLVDARCGSCFTVFRTLSNNFYACGENDHGALGLSHAAVQSIITQIPLSIGNVVDYNCGACFTVFTTKEGGIYTCGYRNKLGSLLFQFHDSRLIGKMCLPLVAKVESNSSELHVACAQSGFHTMLYSVPKIPSLPTQLFTTQQKKLLCDITVVIKK